MNKIIFSLLALILALNVASPVQSSSFKNNIIEGVKFLDDIEEVEWCRVERESLIIGWKGVPKYLPHTNRKAAIRRKNGVSEVENPIFALSQPLTAGSKIGIVNANYLIP